MCDWFEDLDVKKISATNAKDCTMLPYAHTGGSKSNHIRAQEMVLPSPIDAWTVVHKRKDGSFVNDTAKAVDDKMKEERRRRNDSGETTVDEEDIMGNILGKKAGYAKGLGYGVVPSKASRNSQSLVNTSLLEELKQYKKDLQNANDQLKSQEAKL
ncbi:hypothetical protein ACH5RR_029860 [Cinchona calisaya]|uniref:Transposase n=1 Tax=Cinchona calisaya TaxID=153742 RepID=A0ABD2YW44_9GENT